MILRWLQRLIPRKTIVVVSGLPRSGTSMMMKMLEAGGMAVQTDRLREADEDNPKGYYEDERVKDLEKNPDRAWLAEAEGKVLKVISFLLKELPPNYRYKIVFMRRDVREILASQAVMLERRGEPPSAQDEAEAAAIYERHLKKVDYQMRHAANMDFLYVEYRDALENPAAAAKAVNQFLGGKLDEPKMAEVADKSLYRNRAAQTST